MKKWHKFCITSVLASISLSLFAPPAFATELAQTWIDQAPFSLEVFAQNPLRAIFSLLTGDFTQRMKAFYDTYLALLMFLLLGAMVTLLVVKIEWVSLLELLIAGGSFLMISSDLVLLASDFSQSARDWNTFLLGFIPVFSTVIASGGETVAASLYSGFFFIAINLFAQVLTLFLVPLIECYLALSITCAFWIGDELPDACKTIGTLLKKLVHLTGVVFTFIFGIQRVFSAAADGFVIQASKAIGSTVPIIGQVVTSTASTYLASMKLLKTSLGFVAIAVIAAQFLPLYCMALLHLCMLSFCAFLCKLFSLKRCGKLFDCLCVGIEAMMAVVALFFFVVSLGTVLILIVGTGG